MLRDLPTAVEAFRVRVARVQQIALALSATRRGTLLIAGVAAALLLLLVVAVAWTWGSRDSMSADSSTRGGWRYLVVCEACGYRGRTLRHPVRTLEQRGGLLECPHCGEFKAVWYRRGGQAVPPGGWSTSVGTRGGGDVTRGDAETANTPARPHVPASPRPHEVKEEPQP